MMTGCKCWLPGSCCCRLPGGSREPRTGQEFNSATTTGADFFPHPALGRHWPWPARGQSLPGPSLLRTGRPEKRSRICHARCHEGRPNFRRIHPHGRHGVFFQVQRPRQARLRQPELPASRLLLLCWCTAAPPDGNPEGAQRKQLDGRTHAHTDGARPGRPHARAATHDTRVLGTAGSARFPTRPGPTKAGSRSRRSTGGQRWKVKAVEFTGSTAADELTRQR